MSEQYDFECLNDFLANVSGVKKFSYIYQRATRILEEFSKSEISEMAFELEELLTDEIDSRLEREISDMAESIIKHRSWELHYAPPDATYDDVIALLKNWPDVKHDSNPAPTVDDFDDIDVLLDIRDEFGGNVEIAKKFAVLSLMKLNDAASFMLKESPEQRPVFIYPGKGSIPVGFADAAFDAMAAIGYAEQFLSDHQFIQKYEMRFAAFQKEARLAATKENASKGGRIRNEPYEAARLYVSGEWENNCVHYKYNKTAFARDYAKLVAQKFVNAKKQPLIVTEQTICRKWIKD